MFPQTSCAFGRAFVAASAITLCLFPSALRAETRGTYTCPVLHNTIEKVTKAKAGPEAYRTDLAEKALAELSSEDTKGASFKKTTVELVEGGQ